MAERKPFLLRVDPAVLAALQRWAGDDLRSLNGQIEYLLREALVRAGRLKPAPGAVGEPAGGKLDGRGRDGSASATDLAARSRRRASKG